ncbi:hypothetical protein IWW37_001874 [Coemansia sp. RSA 2050]|nr:hypothetical protein IWW37_001874 [Coemansia sp. RSA 2050]KAJ2734768.1 hypothetical protein IW152_002091 [Coemansia sp. BCRC 34962]
MSTGNSAASTDPSSRFISESAIEEARREREAAWKKAYESGNTSTAAPPESEYDPRTLYERLKEQRQKKDESYAESRRFANQIKKLDPEETDFLEAIDEHALEKQRAERQAEMLALAQFKDQVAEKRQASISASSGRVQPGSSKEGRGAAIAALAAVRSRPKRTEPLNFESQAKRIKPDPGNDDTAIGDPLPVSPPPPPEGENALNSLLAVYGSDSDAEESPSSSE